jgi:ATP-dependent NAD(P)H-hydrate dehydratase
MSSTSVDATDGNKPSTWWKDHHNRQRSLEKCIPRLSSKGHKGSSGRVGVLGGSLRYTGAPFYAAMASLKAGSDLSFVFCAEEASVPIKCYSPELMVAGVYNGQEFTEAVRDDASLSGDKSRQLVKNMVEEVTSMMDNLHALVVGPGMGRCPLVMKAVAEILREAQSKYHLPLVLDADALYMLTQEDYHNLLTDESWVVLTPNSVERKRLRDSKARLPDTCIIVEKGAVDKIQPVNDCVLHPLQCEEQGGLKRSGGIGDVLAGTTGTLVAWNDILNKQDESSHHHLPLACWTACCFVKHATKKAFDVHKRSMTAPDVLHALGPTIDEMTGDATIEDQ